MYILDNLNIYQHLLLVQINYHLLFFHLLFFFLNNYLNLIFVDTPPYLRFFSGMSVIYFNCEGECPYLLSSVQPPPTTFCGITCLCTHHFYNYKEHFLAHRKIAHFERRVFASFRVQSAR